MRRFGHDLAVNHGYDRPRSSVPTGFSAFAKDVLVKDSAR